MLHVVYICVYMNSLGYVFKYNVDVNLCSLRHISVAVIDEFDSVANDV